MSRPICCLLTFVSIIIHVIFGMIKKKLHLDGYLGVLARLVSYFCIFIATGSDIQYSGYNKYTNKIMF